MVIKVINFCFGAWSDHSQGQACSGSKDSGVKCRLLSFSSAAGCQSLWINSQSHSRDIKHPLKVAIKLEFEIQHVISVGRCGASYLGRNSSHEANETLAQAAKRNCAWKVRLELA